ncbi:MAG: hypothetical protein JXA10_20185 [Anaerolineae bacterium]|nr:hypothetical protein [Anaerolineae bacterium]
MRHSWHNLHRRSRIGIVAKIVLVAYFWIAIPFMWFGWSEFVIPVGLVPVLGGIAVAYVGLLLAMIGATAIVALTLVAWLLDRLIDDVPAALRRIDLARKQKSKRKPKRKQYPVKRKNEWL